MPFPFAGSMRGLCLSTALLLSLAAQTPDLSMIPGSSGMPPKPLESPLPPNSKNFRPVRLGAWVDETGHVTRVENLSDKKDTTNPAIDSLKKWRFEPVLWEGKAIPFRADVSFAPGGVITMNPLPNFPCENHVEGEFGLVMPSLAVDPEIQIPLEQQVSRRACEAAYRFVVGTDGIANEIEILGASSSSDLSAALNALSGQVYRPGTIDGKPVRVAYKQVISVNSTTPAPEPLLGLTQGSGPLFPYEQLLAAQSGSAKVKFQLNADGTVQKVEVLEASHENFGLSLKACVCSWLFNSEDAIRQPERVYTHEFSCEALPGGTDRLAKLLRKGEVMSSSPAGLNAKPTRVASDGLCFPQEMLSEPGNGSAKIEFIIDRCGLVQVPRILEASHPAFAWAAANWVGSMRFKPLQRAGLPTELRVIVPISFKHPSPPASTTSPAPANKSSPAPAVASTPDRPSS